MSHNTFLVNFSSRTKTYVDSQTLFNNEMADVIIQLHVMTGCDHNCGFYGHGKRAVIEKVSNTPEARALLSECGNNLSFPIQVLSNLKKCDQICIWE